MQPAAAVLLHACALLQPQEIGQALGVVVTDTRRDAVVEEGGSRSTTCLWTLRPAASPPSAPGKAPGERPVTSYVILNVIQWPPGKASTHIESFREAHAAGVLAGPLVPKPLGDEALWWGDGLAVRLGDTSVSLSVHLGSAAPRAQPGANEERLMPHVLTRIGHRTAQQSPR